MENQVQVIEEDIAVEELDEVSGAGSVGTASSLACPGSSASTFGSHS
ncbi:thiocillin family RiPP [Streptomyces sp. NPDC052301]